MSEVVPPSAPDADTEVEAVWRDFWQPIICGADGAPDIEKIKCELYDYEQVMTEVAKVYDSLTNGRISKPNTGAQAVIDEANEASRRMWEREQEYARGDRKPRVYVAGPYTKGDVAVNVRDAIYAGHWLAQAGCVPFVPHLSHFAHLVYPQPYDFWIEQDLAWLAVCDALVRLPGESAGADREEAEARRLGLPVFYAPAGELCAGLAEWLEEWLEAWHGVASGRVTPEAADRLIHLLREVE